MFLLTTSFVQERRYEQCDQIGLFDNFIFCQTQIIRNLGDYLQKFDFLSKTLATPSLGNNLGKIGLLLIPASGHTGYENKKICEKTSFWNKYMKEAELPTDVVFSVAKFDEISTRRQNFNSLGQFYEGLFSF